MNDPLPSLGPLELAVLEHLWMHPDTDVLATHTSVGQQREIAVNTIGSTLERLYRKGLARRWKVSHAYRYGPALQRAEFYARRVVEAAGDDLTAPAVLAAFVDALAVTDAASLDKLEELIARKRREER
jgi:predicted transcriptional regulator